MTMSPDQIRTDLATLAAVIAHSQIVVQATGAGEDLPAGYGEAEIAVLEWIAAQGRRTRPFYM